MASRRGFSPDRGVPTRDPATRGPAYTYSPPTARHANSGKSDEIAKALYETLAAPLDDAADGPSRSHGLELLGEGRS